MTFLIKTSIYYSNLSYLIIITINYKKRGIISILYEKEYNTSFFFFAVEKKKYKNSYRITNYPTS